MTVEQLWWLSLGIAAVVIVVVAVLLGLIFSTAKSVDRTAHGIWTVGKEIAGNTVSIWMLEKTNEHLSGVRESARSLERTAAAMDEKLRTIGSASGGRS